MPDGAFDARVDCIWNAVGLSGLTVCVSVLHGWGMAAQMSSTQLSPSMSTAFSLPSFASSFDNAMPPPSHTASPRSSHSHPSAHSPRSSRSNSREPRHTRHFPAPRPYPESNTRTAARDTHSAERPTRKRPAPSDEPDVPQGPVSLRHLREEDHDGDVGMRSDRCVFRMMSAHQRLISHAGTRMETMSLRAGLHPRCPMSQSRKSSYRMSSSPRRPRLRQLQVQAPGIVRLQLPRNATLCRLQAPGLRHILHPRPLPVRVVSLRRTSRCPCSPIPTLAPART